MSNTPNRIEARTNDDTIRRGDMLVAIPVKTPWILHVKKATRGDHTVGIALDDSVPEGEYHVVKTALHGDGHALQNKPEDDGPNAGGSTRA